MKRTTWVIVGCASVAIATCMVYVKHRKDTKSARRAEGDEDFAKRQEEFFAARNAKVAANKPPEDPRPPVTDAVWEEKVGDKEISHMKETLGVKSPSAEDAKSARDYFARRQAEAQVMTDSRSGLVRTTPPGNQYEAAKVNYAAISGGVDLVKEPDENEEDPALEGVDAEDFDPLEPIPEVDDLFGVEEGVEPLSRTEPYVIDHTEFSHGDDTYLKVTLYYYVDDDTVADENEEVMPFPKEYIGDEAIMELEMASTVWVRNERLGIDYEIIRANTSYAETIMTGENPRTRAARAARLAGLKGDEI